MPSDLRKRDLVMFAEATLSVICPCLRALGRRTSRTATDSVRATLLTCPDGPIITSGGLNGQRGFFTRDPNGQVTGADLAGRTFTRVPAVPG
jgi:hypothetical protein